jgi:homoaconitase/3-isopropylmalate dehydratase large subunit
MCHHLWRFPHGNPHGAFGALAFGIGTSEVEHVLVTQASTVVLKEETKNSIQFIVNE